MRVLIIAVFILFIVSISACGNPEQTESSKENVHQDQGRAETKSIRATEDIGYVGDAVGAKVDAALDANDQRIEDLDKQIDSQTDNSKSAEDE